MIRAAKRAYAVFRGFDDETGAAPMMDGPFRPNAALAQLPYFRRQSYFRSMG